MVYRYVPRRTAVEGSFYLTSLILTCSELFLEILLQGESELDSFVQCSCRKMLQHLAVEYEMLRAYDRGCLRHLIVHRSLAISITDSTSTAITRIGFTT